MNYSISSQIDNKLCTGCGVCISELKSGSMQWNEEGFLVPTNFEETEKSINFCPFNPNPDLNVRDEDVLADQILKSATQKDFRVGKYIKTYVGYSKEYRISASSGGVATYIFSKLLELKIVDKLFIVKEFEGSYQYQWYENAEDIKKISKTRYIPVTLEKLFEEIEEQSGKIAVSGVACFIKAIRLKQYYYPELKEKIPFLIGIICGGLKSKFFTQYLAQKCDIEGEFNKPEYRIKDPNSTASDYSFGAYDQSKNFHQIKMKEVGDMWGTGLFKNYACEFCSDVFTELADISLGDAWLHPYVQEGLGNNVIVTRSALADQLICLGKEENELYIDEISIEQLKSSQSGGFRHRQIGLQYRVKQSKKRGQLIPNVRERFFEEIPWEYKLVLFWRGLSRKKSLVFWQETSEKKIFDKKMNKILNKLNFYTKIYHRISRIKLLFFND